MFLETLDIYQVRNLLETQLTLSPGVNFFSGENASGKTSILESIYLLGRGRSFRSRNIRTIISHNSSQCTVFARINTPGKLATLGVQRGKNGSFLFKYNGEALSGAASLVELLPLQLIYSESFDLLEGGPLNRRQFIDWGVFHVEHSYKKLWKQFNRCLKQRNSLLRRDRIDASELAIWDAEFFTLSERVNILRRAYLDDFLPVFLNILTDITNICDVSILYHPGWDQKTGLRQVLVNSFVRDHATKNTNYGAHRADMRIKVSGKPAAEVLSRGQIKIIVCALHIAQGYLHKQKTGRDCIYLLDDLPSELDERHRRGVGELLHNLGAQVFITGVFQEDLISSWPKESELAMFHVEHGQITSLNKK